MPYNIAAESFHTKNFVADFLQANTKISRFAFLRPPLGDVGATYGDHFRLIKLHFLLVLIELFSLDVMAEELRANIG